MTVYDIACCCDSDMCLIIYAIYVESADTEAIGRARTLHDMGSWIQTFHRGQFIFPGHFSHFISEF
jgi:hypothetical protein